MGGALCILAISVGYFTHKKGWNWLNNDKLSMSPEPAQVPSETEKMKDVEGSFNLSGWVFSLLLSNSRIISPFW